MKRYYLFFLLAVFYKANAQFPVTLHVVGTISFADSTKDFTAVKIFNRRMDDFIQPMRDGSFELYGFKNDTFIFLCQGYEIFQLCYKDSVRRNYYEVHIRLHRPVINLGMVTIVPQKTIDQIQQEIDDLGVQKTNDYQNVNPISSPLTALWEMFSSQERQKRAVAQLRDEDMRRKVMRELLRICVRDHLIDLRPSQTEAFIDYCGYGNYYLQNVTMYDLLSNIKINYHYFSGR